MSKNILTLDDTTSGTYKVTTAHGTYYILDMDKKIGTRHRAEGRGELWADGEPWAFYSVFCKLENSMMFDIPKGEGEYTWRVSTPVLSIEKIEAK